jgi:hypothetical protein
MRTSGKGAPPRARTLGNVVPEPNRLSRLYPTDRCRGDDVKTRANPVALRGLDHWPVMLVTTRLV